MQAVSLLSVSFFLEDNNMEEGILNDTPCFFFLHWQRKEETFPVTTHPLNLLNICYLP